MIRSDLLCVLDEIWQHSIRVCPLSTFAKFSVRVTFFTLSCREGTCVNQGMGKVAFGGIMRTCFMDGPLVGEITGFH